MSLLQSPADIRPGYIATVAGTAYREGIPAIEADAGWPQGVVRRPNGDLLIGDHNAHRIWRIDRQGILHIFCGDGVKGSGGDGGPAAEARIAGPHDLYQDRLGNVYFTDLWNNSIRRIDFKTGTITRVAGSGKAGRGGDGGPATEAEMDVACGVGVDVAGNLYIASEFGNNIRKVDARTGIITRFAGLDARHYPSEHGASRPFAGAKLSLFGYHGDGGPASEAGFYYPEHIAFDSSGDMYVCEHHRIRKIDMKTGTVSTALGTGAFTSNGDGGPAEEAGLLWPDSLFIDSKDNMYVGEKWGYRVRKLDLKSGAVSTLVGNGVAGWGEEGLPGSMTHCNACEAGIWADDDGTVLWGDQSGRTRRYDGQTGIVTTVLGGTSVHDGGPATGAFLCSPAGLAAGPDGTVCIADEWSHRIRAINPRDGTIRTFAGTGAKAFGGDNGAAVSAWLGNPYDVAVDSLGGVAIAEKIHGFIRRVDPDGVIRIIAGSSFAHDRGDSGPAMGACFTRVQSLAYGPGDDLYVGDAVGRIRRIDATTNTITTVAGTGISGYSGDGGPATRARIGTPSAIRFDGSGNMYFADLTTHVVRRVSRDGIISTVAGSGKAGYSPDGTQATKALLNKPWGLAVSKEGSVYVSDTLNHRVRRIGPDGALQTVAGSGTPGDMADGVLAATARLNEPRGLCLYGETTLLISDSLNNRVRAIRVSN